MFLNIPTLLRPFAQWSILESFPIQPGTAGAGGQNRGAETYTVGNERQI